MYAQPLHLSMPSRRCASGGYTLENLLLDISGALSF
jgi:hypothetical protein